MANYVLVYKGGGMPETEEKQHQVMAAWGAWYAALGEAIVDGGNPFGPSRTLAADLTMTDGGESRLSGYTILRADSLDTAADHARGCPVLVAGGQVEIYETVEVM